LKSVSRRALSDDPAAVRAVIKSLTNSIYPGERSKRDAGRGGDHAQGRGRVADATGDKPFQSAAAKPKRPPVSAVAPLGHHSAV